MGVVGDAEEARASVVATISNTLLSEFFELACKPFLLEDFDLIVGSYTLRK